MKKQGRVGNSVCLNEMVHGLHTSDVQISFFLKKTIVINSFQRRIFTRSECEKLFSSSSKSIATIFSNINCRMLGSANRSKIVQWWWEESLFGKNNLLIYRSLRKYILWNYANWSACCPDQKYSSFVVISFLVSV